ncbi:MAG: 3-phosphoglycerate dehydrogenase [Lachnospiraceae bacterium]|nr:3-phosphoglycerate dehydrogenase [Lachnospiraceae bacterium]
MAVKVWLNLDPEKVDVSVLDEGLKRIGCSLLAEAVEGSDSVLAHALDADIVISIMERWDSAMLKQVAGKVKFIQKYGAGVDNIDLKAAGENGIPVANVPGGNSAAVAEVALLHILNCGRLFYPCVAGVKKKCWPSTITGRELDKKTVGLMGYGNIARQLARMLSGFEVRILAYDPFVTQPADGQNVTFVRTVEELFRESNIVSLHIPCNDETRNSIGKDLFDVMSEGSVLVNTCRGGVIVEEDLVSALRSGKLSAVGLDVLAEEPPRADNPLLSMDNVFITSHMGAASYESEERSQRIMAEAINEFLHGRLPAGVRNREFLCG